MAINFKTLAIAAAMAALLAACQKQENLPAEPQEEGIFMTMDLAIDQATKTSYTADGSGLKCTWDASEEISVITYNPSDYRVKTIDTFTYSGDAGKTSATFSGTFTGQSILDAGGTLHVFYPALSAAINEVRRSQSYNAGYNVGYLYSTVSSDTRYVSWIDGADFRMESNGGTSYFKYSDLMYGEATVNDGKVEATLNKIMAVLKIVITCDTESYLGTLYITEDSYAIPYTGDWSFYSKSWYSMNNYSSQRVFVDGTWNYKADGKFVYYLPIIPGAEIPSGTKFTFSADGSASHKKVMTTNAAFTPAAGNIYTINVAF